MGSWELEKMMMVVGMCYEARINIYLHLGRVYHSGHLQRIKTCIFKARIFPSVDWVTNEDYPAVCFQEQKIGCTRGSQKGQSYCELRVVPSLHVFSAFPVVSVRVDVEVGSRVQCTSEHLYMYGYCQFVEKWNIYFILSIL